MKLKTQFTLLVAGIVATPFLLAGIILAWQIVVLREPLPNHAQVMAWLNHAEPTEAQRIGAFLHLRPLGVETLVLGRGERVLASTIEGFDAGESVDQARLSAYILESLDDSQYIIERLSRLAESDSVLLVKIPRGPAFGSPQARVFTGVIAVVLALLSVSAGTSFLILRSLRRSFVKLENATRRVAAGDLDFEVQARGNDELASLSRSFNRMREALKEEQARRARFIMGVSHDLKTPLALIEGYVEAIDDGFADDPATRRKYLDIIRQKAGVLGGMVGDLINFVKLDTGQWKLTHAEVYLSAFVEDLARRYADDAPMLGRRFGCVNELAESATVRMDRALMERALENLLGNALRYSAADGLVRLEARELAGRRELVVSDTGPGIPENELEAIFDPFFRGTSSRREQGFGLGLATVKSIVEMHGFSISVKSKPGEGSSFTIAIPN